jgi:tartrate-resistant acid phosphatase type 5
MNVIPANNSESITRREAIKKTILFSSSLLAMSGAWNLHAQPPSTEFPDSGLDFLALGDFGTGGVNQRAVAYTMAEFAKKLNRPLTGVFALGDNFYGLLTPERFAPGFEAMYSKEHLACPFYACLGNHDYGPTYDAKQGPAKAQMQLDYAKNHPKSRWKMPAKWYAMEFPDAQNPLLKVIFLDSNMFEGGLTPREKIEQKRFLEAEIKKETRAPWRWVISHYPMFSAGAKGDSKRLISEWGPILKANNISLYISGHDHNLQHLEVEGYNTSFIVSGGGGAGLYAIKKPDRGFVQKLFGFVHLHVSRDNVDVQYISSTGDRLHAFRRTRAGKVKTI